MGVTRTERNVDMTENNCTRRPQSSTIFQGHGTPDVMQIPKLAIIIKEIRGSNKSMKIRIRLLEEQFN